MKILIILPRFHTNYVGSIKALKNQGNKVKLLVYNFGFTENYVDTKPEFLKENVITKFINSVFNVKLNRYYLPNFKTFRKLINRFKPDTIIIRPYNKLFSIYLIYLRLFYKFGLVFYNQSNENLYKFNLSLKFIQFFLINNILKIKIYSPIIKHVKKLYLKKYFLYLLYQKFHSEIKKNFKDLQFFNDWKICRKKKAKCF